MYHKGHTFAASVFFTACSHEIVVDVSRKHRFIKLNFVSTYVGSDDFCKRNFETCGVVFMYFIHDVHYSTLILFISCPAPFFVLLTNVSLETGICIFCICHSSPYNTSYRTGIAQFYSDSLRVDGPGFECWCGAIEFQTSGCLHVCMLDPGVGLYN